MGALESSRKNALIALVVMILVSCLIITIGSIQSIISRKTEIQLEPVVEKENRESFVDSRQICDKDQSSDDVIHLAMVCGGYSSSRSLYVLLKSILFYRTNSIHLHLFVDSISRQILGEVFSSWSVDDLEVSFYNLTKHEKEVSWIPNSHYSHRYGLMKLVFISVIANHEDLNRVIMMDTDMLVLGDIKYAWKEFEKLNSTRDSELGGPIFGMVENQSDWYLGATRIQKHLYFGLWPALGRGFNSGTILVDLESLRDSKIDWRKIWRDETENQLTDHLNTPLADQDIFNSIFTSKSWMVKKLPCSFNIQLHDHSQFDRDCKEEKSKLQIVHWNSPKKLETSISMAKFYKERYISFRNWDAKLLENYKPKDLVQKSEGERLFVLPTLLVKAQEFCDNMRPNLTDRLRIYPYYMDFDYEPVEWDVTLVVHLTMDRLQALDELSENWQGPISASIYLPEQETDLLMAFIQASETLSGRRNIGFHLVFRDHGFNYPINRMRNIALNHAVTPYVFLCDVDFIPSLRLGDYLRQSISKIEKDQDSGSMRNKALIVPAFESKEYKFDYPSSKEELKKSLDLGEVSVFRDQIWPDGHKQTDFEKWRSSSNIYEVQWARKFEPFIVTSRDVPRFDERFIGFGWNKVEHITQLAAMRYKFLVLPEAFIIHKIHAPSLDIMSHRDKDFYQFCIQNLKETFLGELRAKYPEFMKHAYGQTLHQDDEERIYISDFSIAKIRKQTYFHIL